MRILISKDIKYILVDKLAQEFLKLDCDAKSTEL